MASSDDPAPSVTISRVDAGEAESQISALISDPPESVARLLSDERQQEADDGLVATLDRILNPAPDEPDEDTPTVEQLVRDDAPDALGARPWSRHVRHADRLIRAALAEGQFEAALRHVGGLGPVSVVWPTVVHALTVTELHRPADHPDVARGALSDSHAETRLTAALANIDWPEAQTARDLVHQSITAMSDHPGDQFEARRRQLVDVFAGVGEADRYRAAILTAACSLHIVNVYHHHANNSSDTTQHRPVGGEVDVAGWHRRMYEQETMRSPEEADDPIDLYPTRTAHNEGDEPS